MRHPLLPLLTLTAGLIAQDPPPAEVAAHQPADREAADRELIAWVREHAVHLDGLVHESTPPALAEALGPLIDPRYLVLLGEPDHSIDEKHDFRQLFLRLLTEHGFRNVGMEMGRSDGLKIDRYLTTGDTDWLRRTALAGDESGLRPDRDDRLPGFDPRAHPELLRRITSGSHWLYAQLRGLGDDDDPWRWFGYDVAFLPGAGYQDIDALLAQLPDPTVAADLRTSLRRVDGETRDQEASRLERCLEIAAEPALDRALGRIGRIDLRHALESLIASLRFSEAGRQNGRRRLIGLRDREAFMARRAGELLDSGGPDSRYVLLGHDLHLSRASTTMHLGAMPMWPSLGTRLEKLHGSGMLVVWLLYDHGTRTDTRSGELAQERPSLPGSLEALLAEAGDCFVLPLQGRDDLPSALREPRMLSMGGSLVTAAVAEHCDVLCFVREVHAPRLR